MSETTVSASDDQQLSPAIIDIDDTWIHRPQVAQSVFHCGNSPYCNCNFTIFYTRPPVQVAH